MSFNSRKNSAWDHQNATYFFSTSTEKSSYQRPPSQSVSFSFTQDGSSQYSLLILRGSIRILGGASFQFCYFSLISFLCYFSEILSLSLSLSLFTFPTFFYFDHTISLLQRELRWQMSWPFHSLLVHFN